MRVSREFINDFAYIANYYGWLPPDIEEVKKQTRENPELIAWWQRLAKAHRAGYRQCKENNWLTLAKWESMK